MAKQEIGDKPCKSEWCSNNAIVGETYCTSCRKRVIQEGNAKSGISDMLAARTLSRRGAAIVGRKCLSKHITDTLGTDTDRTTARD